jgi:hypothetical protein
VSLTGSTLNSPCFADWQTVPAGWTATEPGYFGTLADGRDTLAALQTYRQTGERWKAAYSDLRTEFIKTTEEIKEKMAELEEQINAERRAWRAEVSRGRANSLLWIAAAGGIGFLAGAVRR